LIYASVSQFSLATEPFVFLPSSVPEYKSLVQRTRNPIGKEENTVVRRITTFRSRTDRIYDGGPV